MSLMNRIKIKAYQDMTLAEKRELIAAIRATREPKNYLRNAKKKQIRSILGKLTKEQLDKVKEQLNDLRVQAD